MSFERASTAQLPVYRKFYKPLSGILEFGRFPRLMRLPSADFNTQSLVNIPLNDPVTVKPQTQDDLEPLIDLSDNGQQNPSISADQQNASMPSLYSNSSQTRELMITINGRPFFDLCHIAFREGSRTCCRFDRGLELRGHSEVDGL